MVRSVELHVCAPVYLCWCRADTGHTPHYTKLHGQKSANTTHHRETGTLVLYTHHIRPQNLMRQCSWKVFWYKKKKTLMQLKAGRPTSSHRGELLEWPTVPHNVVFQVWAKRLLLFPGVYRATLTAYHTLPFTVILHHSLFDQCG